MKLSPMLSLRVWTLSAQIALLRARARLLRWLAARADVAMAAILWALVVFSLVLAIAIAPRTSVEVERAQRTTAPWLAGERR